MSPARVDDGASTMALESRRRPAGGDDDEPSAKRRRTIPSQILLSAEALGVSVHSSALATPDELARKGLRRSIALALQHVGFEGAAPEAMESFVNMTETYLSSITDNIRVRSNAARRSHPVPKDFEEALKYFNLNTGLLKPHKKPPIPKSKRQPTWVPLDEADTVETDLPTLSDELDGAPDKAAKDYIPHSFPNFPSIHTYKCTPESIETVTVLKEPPPPTIETASQGVNGTLKQTKVEWPLAPHEIPHGDPKKMREAAAKEAKAGEEALRKLMRASKVAGQKESWASAQREPARRERYDLWESAMRELIEDEAKAKGQEIAPAEMHGEKGREGIADHSMIVNSETTYHRREIARSGARKVAVSGEVISSKG
ncbi:Bromodomain associated-domain-containing protein [Lasiosphaeria hispida]|uniref:Transcription initiation factor TFIID subunit 8 n=1 Tax=Lasiosphaeria hispida TaxID=260671 RepID=A0AAJ0HCR1_9PEZI|nr:Bromodomain associated-domain-containing protein [Lasiosphaeria hispida]